MHHCHCGYCRKSHGTPYATVIGTNEADLHWETQGPQIRYSATPGYERVFCGECGSPLPASGAGLPVFVPNGLLDGDSGHRPEFHMFVASKASWFDFEDGVPGFEAFPPGIDAPSHPPVRPASPAGEGARGRCLCGDIEFSVSGHPIMARYCHCVRCQKARGAARACNLVSRLEDTRFLLGQDSVRTYKVPEARFFSQAFCRRCGSKVPHLDPARGVAIVPMGSFDDTPPALPEERIWTSSRAPWDTIEDGLRAFPEKPPTG